MAIEYTDLRDVNTGCPKCGSSNVVKERDKQGYVYFCRCKQCGYVRKDSSSPQN